MLRQGGIMLPVVVLAVAAASTTLQRTTGPPTLPSTLPGLFANRTSTVVSATAGQPHVIVSDKRWPAAAVSNRQPVKAFGGGLCYDDDDLPHRIVIDVTISIAAETVAGSRQRALQSIQVQFARASEVTMAQFNVWLEMGSVTWGAATLCVMDDINHFASGNTGAFQHLFDFCPTVWYAGLAYVNVPCMYPRWSRGITMIDAGWTIFLHEMGHNLGALHDTEHNGLMQYGGLHAHFAAPASRAAICSGLWAAKRCVGNSNQRLSPATPPIVNEHTNTCDEYVVVATDEYNTAAWVGFVFFLLSLLLIAIVVWHCCD